MPLAAVATRLNFNVAESPAIKSSDKAVGNSFSTATPIKMRVQTVDATKNNNAIIGQKKKSAKRMLIHNRSVFEGTRGGCSVRDPFKRQQTKSDYDSFVLLFFRLFTLQRHNRVMSNKRVFPTSQFASMTSAPTSSIDDSVTPTMVQPKKKRKYVYGKECEWDEIRSTLDVLV
jgi:hypothetical protein